MAKASSSKSAKAVSYTPPLVISAHGIRTRGEWQKIFASIMSKTPARTEAFDYGTYGLPRFLMPPFNSQKVKEFADWYGSFMKTIPAIDLDRYDRRPSAVAHSLGSWIIGNAMLKYDHIRFDKLIFAGSILPRDFDWVTLFARDQVSFVRNECGQKDPWPKWAGRLVARTGTGGSEGFEWFSTAVSNVPCEWFGHSDSLMRAHIETHWIRLLFQSPSPLALLNGRDIQNVSYFSQILNHSGGVIDEEAYAKDPQYEEDRIPPGLSLKWIKINPDIYTFLIDRHTRKPAGYINAMPIENTAYEELRTGERPENKITENDIVPYLGPRSVRVYLMSIAIAEQYRRWGDGILQQGYVQLLTGFLDKLCYYAKNHGIRISHFLATAWTPEGSRICELFSMREVGKYKRRFPIFELDVENLKSGPPRKLLPAVARLLRTYEKL
jgi:hypothetical protein